VCWDGTVPVDPLDDAPRWPTALADVEAGTCVVDGNVDAHRNYQGAVRQMATTLLVVVDSVKIY
jgi:hypothetical protein